MPVCECECDCMNGMYVDEAFWPEHGGLGVTGFSLLRSNHASLSLGVKNIREC
jgi:hypothetical protein